MDRLRLHTVMGTVSGAAMLVMAAVYAFKTGLNVINVGFFVFGLLLLVQRLGPILSPDRFSKPDVSRYRLYVDGATLVAVLMALVLVILA